jgi:hypothetical protein
VLTPLSLRYYVSEPADEVGLLDEAPRCNGGEKYVYRAPLAKKPAPRLTVQLRVRVKIMGLIIIRRTG